MRLFEEKKMFDLSDTIIENIAIRSTGMSLADLENVFSFALRIAALNKKPTVDDETLEEAFETFIYGEEKQWDSSEITRTARHEVGHALVCWYYGETPSYLTIVARGNHGGYMQHDDSEKHGSYSRRELLNRISVALGGRAAELVYYGNEDGLTTGAASDLQTATQIARNIVCRFGMDDVLGPASISPDELMCGDIALEVRRSVNAFLKQALQEAKAIIENNREAVDRMVEVLLQKNHLSGSEIDAIFSERVHRA